MKKNLSIVILVFIFLYDAIKNTINLPSFFKYWDELFIICLIIYMLIKKSLSNNKKIKTEYFFCYIILILCIVFGLVGNFLFKYNTKLYAIFSDIIQFLKFPLSIIILRNVEIDKKINKVFSTDFMKNIMKILTTIIFLLGIISIFKNIGLSMTSARNGILPYKFFFSHSTFLVLYCIFSICYFEVYGSKKNKYYIILLMLTIVLAMRTKGFIFIALYFFFKYTDKWLKRFKILYWILVIVIMYTVAYQKLQVYETYTTSAREVLYVESINFSKKCFPIGTGFATFGSHLSWKSNSKIYQIIRIPFYEVENGDPALVLGDAGFSYYIGQFGLLGLILLVLLYKKIYHITMENQNINEQFALKLLYIYIIIALTSETILVNNGIELAIFIATISSHNKKLEVLE